MKSDKGLDYLTIRYKNKCEIEIDEDLAKHTCDLLIELKQRRECELRPATKFVGVTLFQHNDHNDKFIEEFEEVQAAFYDYTEDSLEKDKEHLIEEIIDVQLTGETWLAGLGLNETDRMKARQKKMSENKARGYYDE